MRTRFRSFDNQSVAEVLGGAQLKLLGPFSNFSAHTLTGGSTGADVVTNAAYQ
jgi:hypothetical protein